MGSGIFRGLAGTMRIYPEPLVCYNLAIDELFEVAGVVEPSLKSSTL